MTASTEMMKTPTQLSPQTLESLIIKGDLSGLNPQQKTEYYVKLCERVGLDPATQPFKLLTLNGKQIMYADKGAGEQLRNLHKISVVIADRARMEDVYYVTARATLPDGRCDESQGAVSVANMKGETLANAIMKAETKAKRRVTLSIIGLGMLDESELETIPADRFAALRPEAQPQPAVVAASNVKQLPAAKPKQEKWTPTKPIPSIIMSAMPAPVRELASIPLDKLVQEDLELLTEHGPKVYADWSKMPGVAPKALKLLQEIVICAETRLRSMSGDAPPPNDAPMDADAQPQPLDHDPVTGEVIS